MGKLIVLLQNNGSSYRLPTGQLDRVSRLGTEHYLPLFIHKTESEFVDFRVSVLTVICNRLFSVEVLRRHEPAVLLSGRQRIWLDQLEGW